MGRPRTGGFRPPDDSLHVWTHADLTHARAALTQAVFSGPLPGDRATASPATSPIGGLSDLSSVEAWTPADSDARPRLFRPLSPNGRAVVLMQGHSFSMNDAGFPLMVQALLTAGFTVCATVMIGGSETTSGGTVSHNADAPALAEFLGYHVIAVNTLFDEFDDVAAIGLSGGGWTATVLAALDTRIRFSAPVAGSLPLDRYNLQLSAVRDHEQRLPGLSHTYLDLYVLGAAPGRSQLQILHGRDPVAFNAADHARQLPYEPLVGDVAARLGGSFRLLMLESDVHAFTTANIGHIMTAMV